MRSYVLATLSPMDMMWVSFYSMSFMLIAMLLIHFTRTKLQNVILRIITGLAAYSCLLIGFLTMVFVIFTW